MAPALSSQGYPQPLWISFQATVRASWNSFAGQFIMAFRLRADRFTDRFTDGDTTSKCISLENCSIQISILFLYGVYNIDGVKVAMTRFRWVKTPYNEGTTMWPLFDHCSCSSTIRTARSCTSREYLLAVFMTPSHCLRPNCRASCLLISSP